MTKSIQVTRSSMPLFEEYMGEILELWDTHWLTNMGPKHNLLKLQLKNYLCVNQIDLLVNGHMALELAIQAFSFPEGGEIITTPFTFASTTHAIVRNRLTPVFCDIDSRYFTMDVGKIESLITDKTVAILPVHVYGNICDVDRIHEIAERHHLKVIYDAAHAFGENYKGIGIGNYGDVSIFSFHATKVFNTIEGGAVCYNDEDFGKRLHDLKNFGIRDEITVEDVGSNAKMNEFCAAMGICNLRHIDDEIKKRKCVFERYSILLDGCEGITIPTIQENQTLNYSYYPIIVDSDKTGYTRDELNVYLKKAGIFSRKYFYPLTCDFACYEKYSKKYNLMNARRVSNSVLTLPMYADLTIEEVDYIVNTIKMYKK